MSQKGASDHSKSKETSPPSEMHDGLVYAVSRHGHRGAYLDLLGPLLRLQSVHGPMSYKMFMRLVGAKTLALATLDQHTASFVGISVVRSILGKPTVALFLRASQCFIPGRIKFTIKHLLYRVMRRVPHLSILTITPFDLAPHFRQVANEGVYDPQYWDRHDGTTIISPPETDLSNRIRQAANGRKIVCALGAQSAMKGFGFLTEIVACDSTLTKATFIVAAGTVPSQMCATADRFVAAGGKLIDRRISDEELESLYGVADIVWSCYAPDYDQASGIFGRAVQYGTPVVLRRGALIEQFATILGVPAISLEWGEAAVAAEILKQTPPPRLQGDKRDEHVERIGSWRENFIDVMKQSLGAN